MKRLNLGLIVVFSNVKSKLFDSKKLLKKRNFITSRLSLSEAQKITNLCQRYY